MKRLKLKKSHIVAIALLLCVAMIAAAGGTLAYFTDDREITNVFTAGNVYISLTEAAVIDDGTGNLVEDATQPRVEGVAINSTEDAMHDYGRLYPGKTMHKDPTIKNTGEDDAWIAAKIILNDGAGDINHIYGFPNSQYLDLSLLLSGGLLDSGLYYGEWNGIQDVHYNDTCAIIQVPNVATGNYEFYFFILAEQHSGDEVELFDTMYILSDFNNSEMQELAELRITVQAFAVQTFGFADCYTAMTQAFSDHFTGLG